MRGGSPSHSLIAFESVHECASKEFKIRKNVPYKMVSIGEEEAAQAPRTRTDVTLEKKMIGWALTQGEGEKEKAEGFLTAQDRNKQLTLLTDVLFFCHYSICFTYP